MAAGSKEAGLRFLIQQYWIRGLINRPLNQLMEGVGKIAEGNLEHKVQMDSQNEFGQLASAFNIMSSELNKKSAELRNKIEALKELDQLKDAFLANTSHELRTPLNGIIGIAESMIDGATGVLSERQKANLAMVVASGKRLSSLVNDILDFSKMRHHDLQLQRSAVDIGSLTEVVLTLSRPLVKQRSLELINELPRDLPAVNADENRLQQILHNLIGNAIKFTAAGQVRVSARILGDDMEISVCDTGIGIAPEKLETIFESFKQAEESTSRQYGGTGLGLAVTKQLVELHGGHIGVESRPGQGSRFFFSLPLAGRAADVSTLEKSLRGVNDEPLHTHVDFVELRSIAQPVRPVELTGNGEVEPQDEAGPATEEYTVLAVDDEPVNLQVINNQLSLHRYRVIEAINGMEALALIEQGLRPDLILLDVMMPRMSGFEVCRKLRERFSARELPVMLLTAKNQATDLIEGFSSGANDYLTKPFSKHELLARIRLHIRLSQASLELIEKEALVREYASNLESSNQQLKQYQSTLEERVEQRTSELKLAHQQLMETEKMASLGGLVAGVAHEINTPVGIGVTAASFLLDEINQIHNTYALGNITREDFDQFLQRALQTADMILSNLRRAAELIKSFKQVAVDQSVEDARQFNLHSYLEDVLTTLHPRLRRTRHEITIDVDPSLVVENYPGTFSQILTNLLMNSLTHAFGNQESGEIHIAMQRQDDQLQMIYTDNGQGIESTHLSRIFDPFFTTRRGQGGTGLGLHIVYNLVTQKLKGRIQCESEPGQGVRFTLTLPCVFITVPALSSNQNPV